MRSRGFAPSRLRAFARSATVLVSGSAVGYYGDDPCRPFDSAAHQDTWGQIKAMFK